MLCTTCGRETGDSFDWKTGKHDQEKGMCRECFAEQVKTFTKRINDSTPETLDAVFISGMAFFGESDEAMRFMDEVDAGEDFDNI